MTLPPVSSVHTGLGNTRIYRPHIDGIRALAILPVVLHHLDASLAPGGFIGVDVFFVVSGYLIARGIFAGLIAGTFTLREFYTHRIKRIIPAYLVMLTFVLGAGAILYYHRPFQVLGETALYSALFSTNLYFYQNQNYFSPAAADNPLLHLWSLGVEEQYYLIFPLLCILVWRWSYRYVSKVFLLLAAGSLFLAAYQLRFLDQNAAFYLLPHRAWELLAGALLATVGEYSGLRRGPSRLAWLGLALILFPVALYNTHTSFPGARAIPPVLGTLILIHAGGGGGLGLLLRFSPLVMIGRLSYSLYLWHWPLLVFWRYCNFGELNSLDKGLVFALSLFVSWVSLVWVENPIRKNTAIRARLAFSATAITCALTAGLSYAIIVTDGFKSFFHREVNLMFSDYAEQQAQVQSSMARREVRHTTPAPRIPLVSVGDRQATPRFILLGDSHATAMIHGFDVCAQRAGIAGYASTRRLLPLAGTTALYPPPLQNSSLMADTFDSIFPWLAAHPEITHVILFARWSLYGGESGGNILLMDPKRRALTSSDNTEIFERGLRETCVRCTALGKKVVLLGPTPEFPYDVMDFWAKSRLFSTNRENSVPTNLFQKRNYLVTSIFLRLQSEGNLQYIETANVLRRDSFFRAAHGNQLLFSDDDHPSPAGAIFLLSPIFHRIFHLSEPDTPAPGL